MVSNFLRTIFLWDLFRGMHLTLKNNLSMKTVTMHYPDKEKWVPYERFRGLHYQALDENGKVKCVACELCAKVCPSGVITVEACEDEDGNKVPSKYEMNLHRCAYCGLCEEACPVDAIKHGAGYEFAAYSREDAIMDLEKLTRNRPTRQTLIRSEQ